MSSWAKDEFTLELARTSLAERYPGSKIEIIETFDIAYSAWECDDKGALITRDGAPEIVIVDRIGGDPRPDIEQVREQLAEYRRLIAVTERVLERYERRKQLYESDGRIVLDVGDLTEAELERLADSEIPADLQWNSDDEPPDWEKRLQNIADEHPHEPLEIVGTETFDMQEFLGLNDPDYRLLRAKWSLVHNINAMIEDGLVDTAALAAAVDMDEKHLESWLRGIVRDVSLDDLAALYSEAAERAGWPTLEMLLWGPPEDGE